MAKTKEAREVKRKVGNPTEPEIRAVMNNAIRELKQRAMLQNIKLAAGNKKSRFVGAGKTLRHQRGSLGSNQGAEAEAQVLQQRATAFSSKLPATSLAIAEQRPETQLLPSATTIDPIASTPAQSPQCVAKLQRLLQCITKRNAPGASPTQFSCINPCPAHRRRALTSGPGH